MRDFTYFTPTKVVFGRNAEREVGRLVSEENAKKVLLHYGGHSSEKSGLLDRVRNSLDKCGISYVVLGGVKPNPRLSLVYEGINLCRAENVDFILAVGGGSVIDSAKAIAYGLAADRDVWDFFCGKAVPAACAPLGCVLTIAAAGSEMSNSCVITNEDGWQKRACDNDISRCRFAIMNPELTYTLPAYQTSCGCADIIMHTLERFFHTGSTLKITDEICISLLRTMRNSAQAVQKTLQEYDIRAEIMWCGSLAHNGLAACGGGGGDWAVHLIEHEIGGLFDVAHGAGLTAIWGSWARYVCEKHEERFVYLANRVFEIEGSGMDTALAGISAMEDFFCSIKMPVSLKGLGISPTEDQMREMAQKCVKYGPVGGMEPLGENDVYQILKLAL